MLHLAPGLDLPYMRVMRRDERTLEETNRTVTSSILFPPGPPPPPPRPIHITQHITALPYSSQLPPATTHSPASPAASAPLDSTPDSTDLERVYYDETVHLWERDGEDDSSAEDEPPQDECVEASTEDLGGCLSSLFSIVRYIPQTPWPISLLVGEV